MSHGDPKKMMICLYRDVVSKDVSEAMKGILTAMKVLEPHLGELSSKDKSARRAIQDAHNEIDVAREYLLPLFNALQPKEPVQELSSAPASEEWDGPSGRLH